MNHITTKTLAVLGCLLLSSLSGCDRRAEETPRPVAKPVQTVPVPTPSDTVPTATDAPRRADVMVHVLKGNALYMETEGMSLRAGGGSVKHGGDYSVTRLYSAELPALSQGMVNVTASAAGYRLLPSGEHFSPAAELRMAYDPDRLPQGYTPDDIYTSYYDSSAMAWVRLERLAVDTASREIVSLTTHFTDFVNEVLKAPEMPETQAFVPTMMSDLEAVNPMEGIPLIQPPTANGEGTANVSYPIWIPAGRGGMQPSLALTYSSGGGNGWLGVGWDIPVPSVTLDTRWGVPRYSADKETEIYLFCGEQLVNKDANGSMLPLPHRTNRQLDRMTGDIRFHVRTGDAHDSIVRHGDSPSDYWWEVTDRNGTTHYYGHYPTEGVDAANPSTLTDDKGNIARWMLCESRDVYDNWVRYYYDTVMTGGENPGRQIYLDSIVYTGHGDGNGVYKVTFVRKERSANDRPTSCNLGFKEETDRVLCYAKVTSGGNDSIVTAYFFETECNYNSNFKTRLTAVDKLDNVTGGGNIAEALLNACADGVPNMKCGISRQQFDYYNAPALDTLFGPWRENTVDADNLKGFMLTPGYRIDSVNRATALGLSHSSSWSVGGTLCAGMGLQVWQTNKSIGGNYHRGKNSSESLMSLVDLDGDGLADRVFVRNGRMYWRKQILTVDGGITFGDTHTVLGATHYLVEGGTSNTFGVQGSVDVASGSGGWTNSVSTTAVYFSDVDGDGLVDIVDNGKVFFNRVVDGQPTFTEYESQFPQGDNLPPEDPPHATSSDCGGIIFDGEVNDSVAYRVRWVYQETKCDDLNEELIRQAIDLCEADGLRVMNIDLRPNTNDFCIECYRSVLDTLGRNLAMDGVPATEAVRVWVAPEEGQATVKSYVRLLEDPGERRASARHADGVVYTIQHSRDVTVVNDTLHSTKDTLLMSRRICADCYRQDAFDQVHYDSTYTVEVKQGDILFFRLRSNDDKQFDNVEDHVKITLNSKVYRSDDGFLLTEDKYFQAPYNGDYIIDGYYNSNTDPTIHLDIKQPSTATHYGSGELQWYGHIQEDSVIRITLSTTNTNADWSQTRLRARIRYWSSGLPDTITVWTPGQRNVVHPAGSVWANVHYRCLFGPLYNGWGQFAYHPVGAASDSSFIRPGNLVPPMQNLAAATSDTAGMWRRINQGVTGDGFNQPTFDDFTGAFGSQYSAINNSSCWVAMTADAEHYRWVAFGAQSSVGRDTLSNSLQEEWYSSVRRISEDSSAHLSTDADYDDAIPVRDGRMPVKAVRKVNRSFNQSYTGGATGFSGSYSHGRSSIEMDYLDLNGDRYPDIVGTHFVQYRSQWGGLGTLGTLPPAMDDITASVTNSIGTSFGASPVSHERMLSGNPSKAKFSLSGDGSLSHSFSAGWDHASSSWTDINGDGLPDFVSDEGQVRLNTGYAFLRSEDWDFEDVHSGHSASTATDFSGSAAALLHKKNIMQGSIQLGAGLSRSANRTGRTLVDINGDGLPDQVWRRIINVTIPSWDSIFNPVDRVHVRLNLGGGRWSQEYDINTKNFNWSESHNESLNAGATLGVTLAGAFKITAGLNGTPYSSSVNRDRLQLVDVNGDGLPDLVSSDSESSLRVRYNRGGMTNLLKTVTNPTGSRIHLAYTLSAPDSRQPSRIWQLTSVATKDPLNPNGGDTTVVRFSYSNPRYDRLERTSYGYGTVITEQINPADGSVYRSVQRDFYNSNILVKGRPKRELTCDGQGNRYIEKVFQYGFASYDGGTVDTCSGNAYSLRDRVVTRFYEGASQPKLATAEAFEYDRYHNVTKYIDEGDSAYTDDGLYIVMTYLTSQSHNLIGLRDSYKVYATGDASTDWMRRTSLEYWPTGKLKKQTMHNSPASSEFEFWYDSYGNLNKVRKPQNDSLQRMEYLYTYDTYTHTYPVKIKDSQGDSVMTSYLLHFGRPTSVVDPTGSTMRYTYDLAGRLLSVTSPLSSGVMPSLLNEYYPINYHHTTVSLSYSFSNRPFAVTKHFDDNGQPITETVVVTDGFGRVIQTKKGITSGGVQKLQVSGRVFTDAFGRAVRQYDPVTESPSTQPGDFNAGYVAASLTETEYDVLDRTTRTVLPMGYVTVTEYGVDDDDQGRRRFWTQVTDPNNHATKQYADYEGRRVQVTDAAGGSTTFSYDALGQLLSSTDPEDFSTSYTYDLLGRLTQRDHLDAGTTHYDYDPAGNMIHETNPLGQIFFDYTYNRLAKKRYSGIVENNVTYTYGGDGLGRGRPVRIEDGTGSRELDYDALGNMKSESRTIAIPGTGKVCRFTTGYEYDSWGRMLTMTYPDGEVVTYRYAYGGDLESMEGDKGTEHHDYLSDIEYNDFGQRSRVLYGNGATCEYSYDALHRLVGLSSMSSTGEMQEISYTIDGVGNILDVENQAAMQLTGLGGAYLNSHIYDDLDRLTASSGAGAAGSYTFSAVYSASGRLMTKNLNATSAAVTSVNEYHYGYCSPIRPHAPRRIYDPLGGILTDLQWDGAGNLGQVNSAQQGTNNVSRFLFWTEDNRLYTVADDKHHSYYAYDHAGDRTLKLTGTSSLLDINADQMVTSAVLDDLTMYPTPYVVATNKGYTKHYYAGSDRVAARIGGGGLEQMEYIQEQTERADLLFSNCRNRIPERVMEANEPDCIQGETIYEGELQSPISDIPSRLNSETAVNVQIFVSMMDYFHMTSETEVDVYFYHSDHLGSASWITDNQGVPVQHLQYLPYGESFVNQRTSNYNERFTFTGKEKDPETGYSYFGARYLDHELMTGWLSVDPMSDKYPSISPYAYCVWNPVKLVDPDGREVINRHTKKIENLKKEIADLECKIKDCTEKAKLVTLNRKLSTKQKSLTKEMRYEKIVNDAIQDLKTYGGDEFEKMDQLTDVNGNNVDVYIQMVDYIDKIGGPEGETDGAINPNGTCSSKMGENTMLVSLSHKYRDVAGKVLAHEGGHVLFDVKHPTFAPAFYMEYPTDKKTGHEPGNISGLVANYYERIYVENYNKSRR